MGRIDGLVARPVAGHVAGLVARLVDGHAEGMHGSGAYDIAGDVTNRAVSTRVDAVLRDTPAIAAIEIAVAPLAGAVAAARGCPGWRGGRA